MRLLAGRQLQREGQRFSRSWSRHVTNWRYCSSSRDVRAMTVGAVWRTLWNLASIARQFRDAIVPGKHRFIITERRDSHLVTTRCQIKETHTRLQRYQNNLYQPNSRRRAWFKDERKSGLRSRPHGRRHQGYARTGKTYRVRCQCPPRAQQTRRASWYPKFCGFLFNRCLWHIWWCL